MINEPLFSPAVSIIIPIYNMELYLEKCISSVLYQTFQSFELILVNDGSTDDSLDICQQVRQKDERVRLLSYSEQKGVSHARNEGIEVSSGKYLFFMDADDQIHPQYLEQLWMQAEKAGADLIMTERISSDLTDEKTWEDFINHPYKPCWVNWSGGDVWDHWYQIKSRNPVWAKLFLRDSVQNLRFDEKAGIAEDTLFNYQYLQKKQRQISYSDSSGYYYRDRKDSSSHMKSLDDFLPCIQIKAMIRDQELSRGHRDYAYTLELENVFRMRKWLNEKKHIKAETKSMQKMLKEELHNPLLCNLSLCQKFELLLACYCLPLNNFLMNVRSTMKT